MNTNLSANMRANGVLVWVELAEGAATATSHEALGMGRRLADQLGGPLSAVVLGPDAKQKAEQVIARGADRVYIFEGRDQDEFHADMALLALKTATETDQPALVLFPHSSYGSELAPRLAFRLGSAPAMGCVDGRVDDGKLLMIRPCYGGRARAVVSFRSSPAIVTLRPKSQDPLPADRTRRGDVIALDPPVPPEAIRITVAARTQDVERGVRLDEAEIVISGGRGLGGPEGFKILEDLADALGGAVGASRPACDLGWYPQAHQVGISGKTVAPELYIAVGISGAGQHMAGCAGAKVLVAVNKDPDAAIFSYAHLGIAAEYQEIIPKILDLIRG